MLGFSSNQPSSESVVAARKRRPFTGLLLKAIHLEEAEPRSLRVALAAPPDKSDIEAHISKELRARYAALDNFFSLESNSPNIWEQRAKALLAHKFGIPTDALQGWEHLTQYLTNRYVPGFSLKVGERKHGAPVKWNFERLAQLFADVEFSKKDIGKSVSKICKALPTRYPKRWGLRKAYAKAQKLRCEDFRFALHLCGPDALIPAKRTDPIQAAIERHALR
jgi:hypothetical protein